MIRCKCGSYAINPHLHGRDGSHKDLCDVCYWRSKHESLRAALAEAEKYRQDAERYRELIRRQVEDGFVTMKELSDAIANESKTRSEQHKESE